MTALLPGATIGILGAGQLARMIALEARRMGYRIAVLDPDSEPPAAPLADFSVTGAFGDVEAASRLAARSDVVTLDTEHVPADVLDAIERIRPLRPGARVLRTIQDRLVQRQFLGHHGIPQPRHAAIESVEALHGVPLPFPCVLKTRRSGYDGKGQVRVNRPEDLPDAWESVGRAPAVLEAFIDFASEVSVVLARDIEGNLAFYPLVENTHRHHILHTSRVPARVPPALSRRAEELGATIAAALGHVGVLAVELFVTRDGELLVNEIAPRTHNSGHYTFGACATSQFEQHVRAVCGLPLGDPSLLRPAVMLNLLGDLWAGGEPDWTAVLSQPGARLHLYGKRRPSPRRKMGHVLVVAGDVEDAARSAEKIAERLEVHAEKSGAARDAQHR